MKSIPMSRSEVDALRKDGCLQLMEHLGEAQPRRGELVLELKSMIKDLLFAKRRTGETTLGFRKDEQESTGRKSTTATDSGVRESHEGTLDQDHKGRPYAAIDSEGLGLLVSRQVRSQDPFLPLPPNPNHNHNHNHHHLRSHFGSSGHFGSNCSL